MSAATIESNSGNWKETTAHNTGVVGGVAAAIWAVGETSVVPALAVGFLGGLAIKGVMRRALGIGE